MHLDNIRTVDQLLELRHTESGEFFKFPLGEFAFVFDFFLENYYMAFDSVELISLFLHHLLLRLLLGIGLQLGL